MPALAVVQAPAKWVFLFVATTMAALGARGLYHSKFVLDVSDALPAVAVSTAIAAVATSVGYAAVHPGAPAIAIALPWATATAGISVGRMLLYSAQARSRRRHSGGRRTLIVGAGEVGIRLARRFAERTEFGLRPVCFIDADPIASPTDAAGLDCVPSGDDLEEVLREFSVDHVVISFSGARHEELIRVVDECGRLGIGVSMVPRLFEKVTAHAAIEHLGGVPLITCRQANPRSWMVHVKYGLDKLVVLMAVPLVFPLFAAAALATWISVGRPIFFRQVRVGRDGKTFQMLKFRSMREPATAADQEFALDAGAAPGGVEGIDRRTRVGTFLRRTSIDELPQLLNVLRGDMSIVGPRPERPIFVDTFGSSVYRYTDRHRMKSGITGWAQVNGLRGKTSIADRAEWDNHYIENWSLWFDLKIVLRTIGAVFGRGVE